MSWKANAPGLTTCPQPLYLMPNETLKELAVLKEVKHVI